ncbi:MAG: tRNA pseudouridine(38-40) synthase TruA [Candidatus Hodarchaeota archaeon]
MQQKIALRVAYLGTDYFGFQRQPNVPTIEGELLKALKSCHLLTSPQEAHYAAAGRTDKGVNAFEQTIAFFPKKEVILPAINSFLPKNIRVWALAKVSESFQPYFSSTQRTYAYFILNSNLDIEAMQNACKILEGKHDFANFAKKDKARSIETVRELEELKIENFTYSTLKIGFKARGFLWEQCRRIASHLLQIGLQTKSLDETWALLSRPVTIRPSPLPAEFLMLEEIKYPEINFSVCQKTIEDFCKNLEDRLATLFTKSALVKYFLQKAQGYGNSLGT